MKKHKINLEEKKLKICIERDSKFFVLLFPDKFGIS